MRFSVEIVDADGHALASFERTLDPRQVKADRPRQDFGLPFASGEGRRIVLRTEAVPAGTDLRGFGWWNDVRLR
jgi:hypothetical protein